MHLQFSAVYMCVYTHTLHVLVYYCIFFIYHGVLSYQPSGSEIEKVGFCPDRVRKHLGEITGNYFLIRCIAACIHTDV